MQPGTSVVPIFNVFLTWETIADIVFLWFKVIFKVKGQF